MKRQMGRNGVWILAILAWATYLKAAEMPNEATRPDLDKLTGQQVAEHKTLVWKRAEVLIEWGFQKGTEALPFDGTVEATQVALAGKAQPLPGDRATTMTGDLAWKSPGDYWPVGRSPRRRSNSNPTLNRKESP